jgi:hypothetical protein
VVFAVPTRQWDTPADDQVPVYCHGGKLKFDSRSLMCRTVCAGPHPHAAFLHELLGKLGGYREAELKQAADTREGKEYMAKQHSINRQTYFVCYSWAREE